MRILNLKQGSKEWLEARKKSFNASETPALFEANPWIPRNPLELAHLKYSDLQIRQNTAMRAGHENEAWIREYMQAKHDVTLEPIVAAWDEDERFRASFDGIDFDGEFVVEIKYSAHTFEALKAGHIPQNYYLQVQHQLLVSEAPKAILIAANPDTHELIEKEIERDENTIGEIVERWIAFEKEYAGKELPPLVEKKESFEWWLAAEEYKIAKAKLDEAKRDLERAKETLIRLADGKRACGDGIEVVPVTSTRYEYAKAKQYIPKDVLESIKKEIVSYRIKEVAE